MRPAPNFTADRSDFARLISNESTGHNADCTERTWHIGHTGHNADCTERTGRNADCTERTECSVDYTERSADYIPDCMPSGC